MEFSIGRWQVQQAAGLLDRPPQALQMEKVTVVAPKYSGSQSLPAQEVQQLKRMPGVSLLPGTFPALQKLFQEMPQGIIHFAGHGEVRQSPRFGRLAISAPLNLRRSFIICSMPAWPMDLSLWGRS